MGYLFIAAAVLVTLGCSFFAFGEPIKANQNVLNLVFLKVHATRYRYRFQSVACLLCGIVIMSECSVSQLPCHAI